MAQRSIFAFDDDEERYEGGGFSEPPREMDDTEPADTDPEGEILEPDEKPEPEAAKVAEPESTDTAAKVSVPEDERWKQSQAQYDFLRDQMIRVNQELAATKKQLEDVTRRPIEKPTEEDWVNDPTAAAEKLLQAKKAEDDARAATERQTRINTGQELSLKKVHEMTEGIFLKDPSLMADLKREFYSNPDLATDPDGPMKAAIEVARRHYKPPASVQAEQQAMAEQAQQAKPSNKSVEDSAAQAERARAAMAKKNVMHGGGKSKAKVTSVDPKLAALARQHGVSIDTIKRMEGIE